MHILEALPLLNQLLHLLARSLPIYLTDARPIMHDGQSEALKILDNLANDQRRYAERVAAEILRLGCRPDPGRFPSEFTAKNDLALDFLLIDVLEYHEQSVFLLEYFVEQLERYPRLGELAEEILDNARKHLESLHRLVSNEQQLVEKHRD